MNDVSWAWGGGAFKRHHCVGILSQVLLWKSSVKIQQSFNNGLPKVNRIMFLKYLKYETKVSNLKKKKKWTEKLKHIMWTSPACRRHKHTHTVLDWRLKAKAAAEGRWLRSMHKNKLSMWALPQGQPDKIKLSHSLSLSLVVFPNTYISCVLPVSPPANCL